MSGFYVSMIFFGILLVIFSLVCIFLDKQKVFQFNRRFDEKKRELVEIINDAEQMIEELNKFSDYVVNQMDLKNEELHKNLKAAEEKVNALSERARAAASEASANAGRMALAAGGPASGRIKAAVVEEAAGGIETAAGMAKSHVSTVLLNDSAVAAGPSRDGAKISTVAVNGEMAETGALPKTPVKKSEKVIPINNKYSEVIRLSQEGLHSLEIAKKLNMGKGEVELILGLRK